MRKGGSTHVGGRTAAGAASREKARTEPLGGSLWGGRAVLAAAAAEPCSVEPCVETWVSKYLFPLQYEEKQR